MRIKTSFRLVNLNLINNHKKFSVTALKNLLSGNSNAPLSSSSPLTIQELYLHKFYFKKTILLTIFVYFNLFWLFNFQNRNFFLLQYIFLKSINIRPLISHFLKITNHWSIFLKISIYIQIVIRLASIHRLSIFIIDLPTTGNTYTI